MYVQSGDWTTHDNYPGACTNQFVTTIGDSNTCVTVTAAYIGTGEVKDDEIDYTVVTLADFPNDAGYVKNASTAVLDGLNVTGTSFTCNAADTNCFKTYIDSGGNFIVEGVG